MCSSGPWRSCSKRLVDANHARKGSWYSTLDHDGRGVVKHSSSSATVGQVGGEGDTSRCFFFERLQRLGRNHQQARNEEKRFEVHMREGKARDGKGRGAWRQKKPILHICNIRVAGPSNTAAWPCVGESPHQSGENDAPTSQKSNTQEDRKKDSQEAKFQSPPDKLERGGGHPTEYI